jgi:hypothetical protein
MFMEEDGFQPTPPTSKARTKKSPPPVTDVVVLQVYQTPESPIDRLTSSYVNAIKTTTDMRYNLAWSYGDYLVDIPQRLGVNPALDASVDALVCAHSNICSGRKVTLESLQKYSAGLKALRDCLDDPSQARTSETLCAVMLLMNCQVSRTIDDGCGRC